MIDQTDQALVIAVESLKLRLKRVEDVLTNFVGVFRDSDGVLRYGKQDAITPSPEPETPNELEAL